MDIPVIPLETAERFRRKSCGEEGNGKNRRRWTKICDSRANLKKVLALVLAFACAFTMFAGAAFTDQADIKVDSEVVDTLVSLGVVEGFEDGSFQPNATVTRAQMAKMIYVLRTGNSDASAYNDDKTTFTDIGSHWARGYIKYCQSLGIIAGKSNTIFAPNEKVSAQEAAKMLLVTLGYNAQKAGLVGTGWASKTNALADENGLLEDVNTSFTSACPRQYAAQLIYNAIDAETVVLRDGAYTDESALGIPNKTVGEKYMNLSKAEGILVASGKTGINGQVTAKEDSLAVNVLGTTAAGAAETTYDYVADVTFTKVAKDYTDLLGQVVKVLYKNGDKSKVYGVFATDDNNVLAGNSEDLEKKTNNKVKFDGTEYDVAASTKVVVNGVTTTGTAADLATAANAYKDTAATFSLVDNNDDDKYDVLIVVNPTVAKVTYAGSTSITAGKSYKYDDENIEDGIKKDDYVAIVDKAATKDGKYDITKAETVTGKIESIKGTDVKVGGTWYKTATGAEIEDTYSLNDTFTLAVVNGFVYHAEQGDEAISNDKVLLVTKADDAKDDGIDAGTQKVKALFSDGTEKQITVAQLDSGSGYKDMHHATTTVEATRNTLYTFTTKSNGDYKLKVMDNSKYDGVLGTITGIDDGKATGTAVTGSGTTMRFADSAAIFVVPGNGDDAKVITGKALGTWKNITALTSASTVLYGKKDGGIVYANVGVVVMASSSAAPSSGDVEYGFVTADSSLVKDGDDYYVSMTIWNGSSEIAVKADSYYEFNNATDAFTAKTDVDDGTAVKNYTNASSQKITSAFAKKTPVSYKTTGDGLVSEVRPLNVVKNAGSDNYLGAVAVTGFKDGKKYVSLDGTDYDLTSDTVTLFVDTDAKTGETTGAITEANEVHGYFVKNAYAVVNSDNEVEFILVDTQNNLENNSSEDDVKLTKGSSLSNVVIDNENRVVELKGDTVAVNKVDTTDAAGIAVAGAGQVIVIHAGTNLAAGDTIRVIAENGDVVDYTVK